MITWPTWLPNPEADFNVEVDQSSRRTRMDSGRFRQRRRFERQYRSIDVTWDLNELQRAAFTAIFKEGLNNGADWFYMSLPIEEGFTTCTVRFSSKGYSEKYSEVLRWIISASLEMQEQVSAYTEEEINDLLEEDELP